MHKACMKLMLRLGNVHVDYGNCGVYFSLNPKKICTGICAHKTLPPDKIIKGRNLRGLYLNILGKKYVINRNHQSLTTHTLEVLIMMIKCDIKG